jgi:hypothetical protein
MSEEEKLIYVENLHLNLTDKKINEITNLLKQHDITINYFKNLEPRASLFETINIIFNEPITKQILLNLISAGAFEAIKTSLLPLYNSLNKIKIIKAGGKQEQPSLNIMFKTKNNTLNILIPSNLPDNQFKDYLDMAQKTIIELGKGDILKSTEYNEFVLESEEENKKSLKVKTMREYIFEHYKKHK